MITLTGADLKRFSPTLDAARAELYASVLTTAFEAAEINTNKRLCHFLGQAGEETGGLTSLVESTRYTNAAFLAKTFSNVHGLDHANRLILLGKEAIGNTIYAGKNGNGDVDSGDGYRFRGRGFLQVTGRSNYKKIGLLTKLPLLDQPELLGQPSHAADSAAAYWKANKINIAADADDVGAVTGLVNGGARLHQAERQKWRDKAKKIWPY